MVAARKRFWNPDSSYDLTLVLFQAVVLMCLKAIRFEREENEGEDSICDLQDGQRLELQRWQREELQEKSMIIRECERMQIFKKVKGIFWSN